MVFKHLFNVQSKYELDNLDSATNYAWDLNKPIYLSLLSYDTMSSLSLCELTKLETSREQC